MQGPVTAFTEHWTLQCSGKVHGLLPNKVEALFRLTGRVQTFERSPQPSVVN